MNYNDITVIIPTYNEEANIEDVVRSALEEARVREVIVADDRSADRTADIVSALARSDHRVKLSVAPERRSGQLSGWLRGAALATTDILVFIDADSIPHENAIAALADGLRGNVAVSGRIIPVNGLIARAGQFSARLLHLIREWQLPEDVIIGRFFAVDRYWFLKNVKRTDIIANDAYVGCLAAAHGTRYIANACIYYHAPESMDDHVGQRTRANDGYNQLRKLGILPEPKHWRMLALSRLVFVQALRHPRDFGHWFMCQLSASVAQRSKSRPPTATSGMWEAQATTKQRVDRSVADKRANAEG